MPVGYIRQRHVTKSTTIGGKPLYLTSGKIRPAGGGLEVRFYDYPGLFEKSQKVTYKTYGQGRLVKAYGAKYQQASVSPVASAINGKQLKVIKKTMRRR